MLAVLLAGAPSAAHVASPAAFLAAAGDVLAAPDSAAVEPGTPAPEPNGPSGDAAIEASIGVYAGYYDTHHHANLKTKPSPWKGSSNTVFVGNSDTSTGGWDTSAIRVDNWGSSSITVTVTVDIGTHHYALWGSRSVPAGWHLIVAQTGYENFDGSDTNPAGCYSCDPNDCLKKVSSTKPVVHVTIGSTTTNYVDTYQILNTKGVDAAGCPYTGTRKDESQTWSRIYPATTAALQAAALQPEGTPGPLPEVAAFPNPNYGYVQMRFHMPVAGPARLGIYDVHGRLVRLCMDTVLEAGDYAESAVMLGQAPGVYFCKLRTTQGEFHRGFMLLR